MSVATSRSEGDTSGASVLALHAIRSRGGASVGFAASGDGRTRLSDLHEWGGFRAKLPRTHGLPEAVLINTGGGLLGGDRISFDVTVGAGASAQVTTQSAERVYRSLGPETRVAIELEVGAGGRLHWLPQETILFDHARLSRTITVRLARGATLLMVEATMIGRAAMNEEVEQGALRDIWRISREGRLVFAEAVDLSGNIREHLSRPAVGAGARAFATVLYVAEDAADKIDDGRRMLARARGRTGLSAWNGVLAGRFLAQTMDALKADLAALLTLLSGHALPRVWGLL